MLCLRVQGDAGDDHCRADDVVQGNHFAKHKVGDKQPEYYACAFEKVGVAHGHALDDLLPDYGVHSQYKDRSCNKCDVGEAHKPLLRSELREYPRTRVNSECPHQGDVLDQ